MGTDIEEVAAVTRARSGSMQLEQPEVAESQESKFTGSFSGSAAAEQVEMEYERCRHDSAKVVVHLSPHVDTCLFVCTFTNRDHTQSFRSRCAEQMHATPKYLQERQDVAAIGNSVAEATQAEQQTRE